MASALYGSLLYVGYLALTDKLYEETSEAFAAAESDRLLDEPEVMSPVSAGAPAA
jgi:hypothetical protein